MKHWTLLTFTVDTLQESVYYSWQEMMETGEEIARLPSYVSELEFLGNSSP